MPMCKLVHMHTWHNYITIYTSYEINIINNVTRSSGSHKFYIIGICPWTNMPATLHIDAPLHFYNSLHIDPTLPHISMNNKKMHPQFTMLLPYMCKQQIYPHMQITQHTLMGRSMPIYLVVGLVFSGTEHQLKYFTSFHLTAVDFIRSDRD